MAKGNRGFADIAAAAPGAAREGVQPPLSGILAGRENRLAEMAAGTIVTRVHQFVDPARCRIWEGHNRRYEMLDETRCEDLIESFRAQGRQEVPAIVRRVVGDPEHEFEVICGARRHWTVSWLRAHAYPEFRFLIEPRELSDEEAFRLSDLENRHRRDLSDYERAVDYARAIERYYEGSQIRMVERLQVTKSWLSRYLELARLPEEVLAAFGSTAVIGISHAAALAPALGVPVKREAMLKEARVLAAQQALAGPHGKLVGPADVVRQLRRAAAEGAIKTRKPGARGTERHIVRGANGMIVAMGKRAYGQPLVISVQTPGTRNREVVLAAVREILDVIAGPAEG